MYRNNETTRNQYALQLMIYRHNQTIDDIEWTVWLLLKITYLKIIVQFILVKKFKYRWRHKCEHGVGKKEEEEKKTTAKVILLK